jgi:hypothetical protein
MADSPPTKPDSPNHEFSDSSIDEDEGEPIHISEGDLVRYFFLGKFGDKSSLRTSTIKRIEVKYCTIMESQTVELFLAHNYIIKFPSQFQPLLDENPLECGFISCENPRIKVVERDATTTKAVDGRMKQLRNSIDNIQKAANSLGYANEEITNQTSESLNTTNKAEDRHAGSETNNDSLFGSEHKLLAIKPPVPTNMKPKPLTSNMFCNAASSHIQWDPQYSEKCIADFQHNVNFLPRVWGNGSPSDLKSPCNSSHQVTATYLYDTAIFNPQRLQ